MPSDNVAGVLNKAEVVATQVEQQSAAAAVPATATPVADHFLALVETVETMAEKIAAIEEAVSKFIPHLGPLAVIMPIADELAALVEGLKRGRNTIGS